MIVKVRVFPSARRNEIISSEGILKVYLTERPEKGRANKGLLLALSEHFGVSRSSVKIIRGLSSRNKVIEVKGL
jgi:uncharacterized protein (TIGR00251 family)